MGFRKADYIKVNDILATRRSQAEADAQHRLKSVHAKIPELAKIDAELAKTGARVFEACQLGSEGVAERIERIKKDNLALQARRAAILVENGYPADYTEPRYFCKKCSDTGYDGTQMCECKRRELVLAGYESSGMGELLKTQSFETFSLDYYKYDSQAYATMKHTYEAAKSYAENFTAGKNNGNLLFIGATGLGKTHLSTSIAREVINKGFDVKYDTIQNIIMDFEQKQFHAQDTSQDDDPTERYFECDLLIIDDLGTELTNQFTLSCLYNLINTRINRAMSMIISTNLSPAELRRRYAERITSRLFGEFLALPFAGGDVRAAKLREE
ncbi:MAG: ATP-binding protein [Clostridiales bacterium]|nr:ATP-binding protein [Clostridiales bacterium]